LLADPTAAFLGEAITHCAAFFGVANGPFLDGATASVAPFFRCDLLVAAFLIRELIVFAGHGRRFGG
jgi:hypothetical protein